MLNLEEKAFMPLGRLKKSYKYVNVVIGLLGNLKLFLNQTE